MVMTHKTAASTQHFFIRHLNSDMRSNQTWIDAPPVPFLFIAILTKPIVT
jgi:hypothetical protein